jgi:hypothetical protein
MRKGDRFKILGDRAGVVVGEVVDVRDVAALPLLPNTELVSEIAKQILLDDGVHRIAFIAHAYFEHDSDKPILLMFAALEDAQGWRDLKGQRLTLTPMQRPMQHERFCAMRSTTRR